MKDEITSTSGVALLIDGDNLSAARGGKLIMLARGYGPLVVKRVYGNVTKLGAWLDAPGFRLVHAGVRKNAADIVLSIDAIDLAHDGQIGTFVIASSDGDLAHIAHRLCEKGFTVIGLGEEKAPPCFTKACSHFHLIQTPTPKPRADLSELDRQIHDVIEGQQGRRSLAITRLNAQMRARFDVRISQRAEKTWRRYLEARPKLYRCDAPASDARVTLLHEDQR